MCSCYFFYKQKPARYYTHNQQVLGAMPGSCMFFSTFCLYLCAGYQLESWRKSSGSSFIYRLLDTPLNTGVTCSIFKRRTYPCCTHALADVMYPFKTPSLFNLFKNYFTFKRMYHLKMENIAHYTILWYYSVWMWIHISVSCIYIKCLKKNIVFSVNYKKNELQLLLLKHR